MLETICAMASSDMVEAEPLEPLDTDTCVVGRIGRSNCECVLRIVVGPAVIFAVEPEETFSRGKWILIPPMFEKSIDEVVSGVAVVCTGVAAG